MVTVKLNQETYFIEEKSQLSGVKRVANMVRADLGLIFGRQPIWQSLDAITTDSEKTAIFVATIGQSAYLDDLLNRKMITASEIENKREVYQFQVIQDPWPSVKRALIIVGSDKRGTIYGLFHLSELLGVSPFVNWSDLKPKPETEVTLTDKDNFVSREPSVKYRGFFINDEWPAFGNWAKIHFGGANAACYAQLFEVLLRLKGNYLWPAMWKDNFSLDGPGLKSAALADELGVVMSTSHHEPCMRSGEEYTLVRGKNSPYGDAWDFQTNRDGIIRFWKDGLKRNAKFENVITLGMRGERDTAIMKNATMAENIALLKDVLKVQNELIKQEVNSKLSEVARQIVMFNEVESFFYGDDTTPGLIASKELDGVTIMYSDNNLGYMRTLPSKAIQNHRGGFGMYYHMDMHGGPTSFEWIGSTSVPRIWDQMSTAYDYGVQEIWIANVGDLATNELSLSYFLDMAYDMDHYGSKYPNNTEIYIQNWLKQQFGNHFTSNDLSLIQKVIDDYMLLLERRKHEVMGSDTYHPVHFGESDTVLSKCQEIMQICQDLRKRCPAAALTGFVGLVYYPAVATANLMQTWIYAGKNQFYAQQNRVIANDYGNKVRLGIQRDHEIIADYHQIGEHKFDGFGLSEHFGFRQWSANNNQYPLVYDVTPANLPRMIVSSVTASDYSLGEAWTNQNLVITDFMRPDVTKAYLDIACGSRDSIAYEIINQTPWLHFSRYFGEVQKQVTIEITFDRKNAPLVGESSFQVKSGEAVVDVKLPFRNGLFDYPSQTFIETNDYLAIPATAYVSAIATDEAKFVVLEPYGKFGSGVKVFPQTIDFMAIKERPELNYHFAIEQVGQYELTLHFAPTLPVSQDNHAYIQVGLNENSLHLVDTVLDSNQPFYNSPQWAIEGTNDEKQCQIKVNCRAGLNLLRYIQISPNLILERITLVRLGSQLPQSYLGPTASYKLL